jgi:diacylglycerol O-acyltransferase
MLQTAAKNLAVNPIRQVRLGLNIVREFADAAGVTSVSGLATQARSTLGSIARRADPNSDRSNERVSLPITSAPPTPWNASVTPDRRFAMRSTSLENLKRLKDATGGTLNDVVMAICTGALREYLIEKDALPDGPLRAMVPVSIRTGDEEDPWTNRVSAIVADLPTHCPDPVERVAMCREAMNVGKHQFDLMPAEALGEAADYTSPVVAASAIRLVSRLKLADRVNSPINVVISNVPGPRRPLYFAGAKLDAYIPVSTITDGVGLNITVHSYADRMDFGLISDRELVPDLWHLVDLHIAEVERLFEATGAEWAVPQPPPPMRYGGDGVDPIGPSNDVVKERVAVKRAVTKRPSVAPKKAAAKKTAVKKKTAAKQKPAKKK